MITNNITKFLSKKKIQRFRETIKNAKMKK